MSTETEQFNKLEELFKIESSLQKKQEIVKNQIRILQNVQKQFIEQVKQKGIPLDSYNILEMIMKQYKGMKQLAEKVGLSTEIYDIKIEQIKCKIFGRKV